jgi:hypothetical protein
VKVCVEVMCQALRPLGMSYPMGRGVRSAGGCIGKFVQVADEYYLVGLASVLCTVPQPIPQCLISRQGKGGVRSAE